MHIIILIKTGFLHTHTLTHTQSHTHTQTHTHTHKHTYFSLNEEKGSQYGRAGAVFCVMTHVAVVKHIIGLIELYRANRASLGQIMYHVDHAGKAALLSLLDNMTKILFIMRNAPSPEYLVCTKLNI